MSGITSTFEAGEGASPGLQTFDVDSTEVFSLADPDARQVWRLRPDVRRGVLYAYSTDSSTVRERVLVHPRTAVLLALVNGRSFSEFSACLSKLFDLPEERAIAEARAFVSSWVERGVLVRTSQRAFSWPAGIPRPEPRSLVLPVDEVDLTRRWLYRPLELVFRLTPHCARSCRYCNVERNQSVHTLEVEEWLELADQAISVGVQSVLLSGGDPLLSPACLPLIERLSRGGIHPALATKVQIRAEQAQALAAAGLRRIQVSIDSHIPEVSDYLLQSSGSVRQLIESIRNCRNAGLTVRVNSVITPLNAVSYPSFVRQLAHEGVDSFGTSQYGYSLFGDDPQQFLLSPSLGRWLEGRVRELRQEGYHVAFGHVSRDVLRRNFSSRARCTVGESTLIINPDGGVVACEQLPSLPEWVIGNVRDQSLLEIWESAALWTLRRPDRGCFSGTVCGTCELFETCIDGPGICYRRAYYAHRRIFAPDPACPRSPRGRVIEL